MRQNALFLPVSAERFSLKDTLTCGQCFRFEETDGFFTGVVSQSAVSVRQQEDGLLITCGDEYGPSFWKAYFDLDGCYDSCKILYASDPVLEKACAFAGRITILRQDVWETLCSFILSQNNNIPRIKGIVRRLCETFGEPLENGAFSFPSPERISYASEEELSVIRAGFRAKYLMDAARKISSVEIDLTALSNAPSDRIREALMTIHGVGPKVAECVLLYGFHRLEAFPADVWIKRVMEQYYPNGLPESILPTAGVAQQYLFHSIRLGVL